MHRGKDRKEKLEKWQMQEWISASMSRDEKDRINADVELMEREWRIAYDKWLELAKGWLEEDASAELEKFAYPLQTMVSNFITQVRGIPREARVAFLEDFGEQYVLAALCCFAVGYQAGLDALAR